MAKIFNDPVYGRIKIPEYCVKIIDSIPFQRLRNLKQLGLTSYVFYGAQHTRFEHSIGVCWLSGEWVMSLERCGF
jgi:HD superfamily phosphohydrolase